MQAYIRSKAQPALAMLGPNVHARLARDTCADVQALHCGVLQRLTSLAAWHAQLPLARPSQLAPLSALHSSAPLSDAAAPATGRGLGSIELVVGPMFAGKTSELLRRVRAYQAQGLVVAVIKSDQDDRYSEGHVVTHDGEKQVSTHLLRWRQQHLGMAWLPPGIPLCTSVIPICTSRPQPLTHPLGPCSLATRCPRWEHSGLQSARRAILRTTSWPSTRRSSSQTCSTLRRQRQTPTASASCWQGSTATSRGGNSGRWDGGQQVAGRSAGRLHSQVVRCAAGMGR